MTAPINFTVGLPLKIMLASAQTVNWFSSRVLAVSEHTLVINIPYESGRILLWPVGTRLQITIEQDQTAYTFNTEIIDRQLGSIKSYTIMRPYAISRTTNRFPQKGMTRVIAVTSGKGGVGKTTFTINLAIALADMGQKVFIIDADLGTANVDVLLRLNPKYNITHLITGEKNLLEIAIPAPGNIGIIPGGSGLQELTQLNDSQFTQVINSLNMLDGIADIILIDTGAGISKDVSNFLLAADEVIVITTPEPHAMTDAYAIVKVMHLLHCQSKQLLVVNRVEDEAEAEMVSFKLLNVIKHFLGKELDYIGYIQDDRSISRSLKDQYPLILSHPSATPVTNIKNIAARLINKPQLQSDGITGFINKFCALFKSGRKII